MNTKERVLKALEEHRGDFISGAALAQELELSRNSIWKAIKALQQDGHSISSGTNKGYRLDDASGVLSKTSIVYELATPGIAVEYHKSIDSTNNRAKLLAAQGCPHGTLIVANEQTAGRGRQGRPFYSPADSGVYFSLVLRPSFSMEDVTLLTSYAAVCCVKAIEDVFGVKAGIKWVNDVFVGDYKCCGILTEASVLPETGSIDYVVVGIGINISEPKGGFPPEFASIAHALSPKASSSARTRAALVAKVVDYFMEDYAGIPTCAYLDYYRERSILTGRNVHVFEGNTDYRATVLGINDDFTLEVQLEDGMHRVLNHGEVHIPSAQLGNNAD